MPHERPLKLFGAGALTCLLNPKLAVLHITLLPQFVQPEKGRVALQSAVLGLTQTTVGTLGNAAFVLTAGALAGFRARRPLPQRLHDWATGTLLAGFALRIATERSRAAVAWPRPAAGPGDPDPAAHRPVGVPHSQERQSGRDRARRPTVAHHGRADGMVFDGSIPGTYQQYMVPIFFRPYARDLAARLSARRPARVLETAAGTGAVTRELAAVLPGSTEIVATDLSAPMIEFAAAVPFSRTGRPVDFRPADALDLPFPDGSFDAVVCQFGAMFFPDRPRAFAEARRVLRPGGVLLFNVWDHIAANEFAATAASAVAALRPEDPPDFLSRVPYGYHDHVTISRDVAAGGFEAPRIETVDARSRAGAASDVAMAFCHGTPMRDEIESRPDLSLAEATDVVTNAVEERFGGPVEGAMRAHVVTAVR